ncbi:hypothetical protein GCM10010411_47840 [Actinomadura fulvescens]|uniref:PilZ domain-containing protein n=1 Tax=Actinomadura fulvescens TaxID=46160 RepID=A0ABP6CC18_9ACTN
MLLRLYAECIDGQHEQTFGGGPSLAEGDEMPCQVRSSTPGLGLRMTHYPEKQLVEARIVPVPPHVRSVGVRGLTHTTSQWELSIEFLTGGESS